MLFTIPRSCSDYPIPFFLSVLWRKFNPAAFSHKWLPSGLTFLVPKSHCCPIATKAGTMNPYLYFRFRSPSWKPGLYKSGSKMSRSRTHIHLRWLSIVSISTLGYFILCHLGSGGLISLLAIHLTYRKHCQYDRLGYRYVDMFVRLLTIMAREDSF